jgi:hypothetical protein
VLAADLVLSKPMAAFIVMQLTRVRPDVLERCPHVATSSVGELTTNEYIITASCDAAIEAHREGGAPKGHLPVVLRSLRIGDFMALG